MTTLEKILENYPDEKILIADGFDEAIIGMEYDSFRVVYSVTKCLKILEEDMSEVDAVEYFTFNIAGGAVGEQTPIWCWDNFN